MARRRQPKSFAERMRALGGAGLKYSSSLRPGVPPEGQLIGSGREERLENLITLLKKNHPMRPGNVLVFIMYDIENNRIRRYIAKYLEREGYVRVQRSVFFGNVDRARHGLVVETLKEVNEKYENGDSLMFLPVSSDMFHSLKVVGKNLEYEMTIEDRNTLFI